MNMQRTVYFTLHYLPYFQIFIFLGRILGIINGIIVFVKNNLDVDFFLNMTLLKLTLLNSHLKLLPSNLTIFCMYRSPSTDVSNFNNTLKIILGENTINTPFLLGI
jgi:hypothetical protein